MKHVRQAHILRVFQLCDDHLRDLRPLWRRLTDDLELRGVFDGCVCCDRDVEFLVADELHVAYRLHTARKPHNTIVDDQFDGRHTEPRRCEFQQRATRCRGRAPKWSVRR